jgi:hypothetical protein
MFTSREVMHCKPGRAKDLVAVFKKAAPIMKEFGISDVRIFTDISGANYWTVVIEQDVRSIDELPEDTDRPESRGDLSWLSRFRAGWEAGDLQTRMTRRQAGTPRRKGVIFVSW